MLVYRAVSGALAVVLGAIILEETATLAVHEGAKITMGIVFGLAVVAWGAHRVWVVWRIRSGT